MKILTLFNEADFEVRKPANQKDFEERYKNVLLAFPAMVDRAFLRLNMQIFANIEPESRNRNLAAVSISGFLQGAMVKTFPDYCHYFINHNGSRFKMRKENYEWLFVKKLDDNKRPSNIETDTTLKIMKQLSESSMDLHANVFLGYVASDDNSFADAIYAVYIVDKKVEWFTDLRGFVEKNSSGDVINPVTAPVPTELKEGTVTIKQTDNA